MHDPHRRYVGRPSTASPWLAHGLPVNCSGISVRRNSWQARGTTGTAATPATFQAAIDACAPVVPLSMRYRSADGQPTTVAAFLCEDTLIASLPWITVANLESASTYTLRCTRPQALNTLP